MFSVNGIMQDDDVCLRVAHVRMQAGASFLSCNGQRTMRTCLEDAERLSANDISEDDFQGAKWVFLSGYILYR